MATWRGRLPSSARAVCGMALAALWLGASAAGAPVASDRAGETTARPHREDPDSLQRRALQRLARGSFDQRRLAIEDLDRATRERPERSDLWRDLGRACTAAGHFAAARDYLERAAALDSTDADIRLHLGLAYKWLWLESLDRDALVRAVRCFMAAADLERRDPEPRIELTALALAVGDSALAARAAASALRCDPDGARTLLAAGCQAYRAGDLQRADAAFRDALPRLPAEDRARLSDLSPIAGDAPPAAGAESRAPAAPSAADFWRLHDPDLTTPENEAELDYLARVAHALLLFRDESGLHWDMRAELFVRYGMPASIDYNPTDDPLAFHYRRLAPAPPVEYRPPPLDYPYNLQRWSYPALGIRVDLWDQSLQQSYQLPIAYEHDPDPRPDPGKVDRPDLVVLGQGRGVYRSLPPGVAPLAARAEISRFPADEGARLVANLEAAGGPSDSLEGWWAVVGADGRAVARGRTRLAVSACDPAERRVAELSAQVPPGEYRADLAVSDAGRRRGVLHFQVSVPPAPAGLDLSDLVLLCGPPALLTGGSRVRLEPDFDLRLSGVRSLSAYFEIAHLEVGGDGQSRFRYVYALRPAGRERRPGHLPRRVFEASREEAFVGPLRRQFVTVPIGRLRRGDYDLEIEVTDLLDGATAGQSIRFTKQ